MPNGYVGDLVLDVRRVASSSSKVLKILDTVDV
jgi:hypothetical protein